MTIGQVTDLLGVPDRVTLQGARLDDEGFHRYEDSDRFVRNAVGCLNPKKRGDIEFYKWGDKFDFIMLGFENGRLLTGGVWKGKYWHFAFGESLNEQFRALRAQSLESIQSRATPGKR